jgi:hypothetical protein
MEWLVVAGDALVRGRGELGCGCAALRYRTCSSVRTPMAGLAVAFA